MRITESQLELKSSHLREVVHTRTERLEVWVGDRPEASPALPEAPPSQAKPVDGSGSLEPPKDDELTSRDLHLVLKALLIEKLMSLGKQHEGLARAGANEIQKAYASEGAAARAQGGEAQPQAGFGLIYDRVEQHSETEVTIFSAQARVRTADGRQISLDAAMTMARQESSSSEMHLRLGDAVQQIDPLILGLGFSAPALSDQRMQFDLDSDGQKDSVAMPGSGSAFLALDHNGNGRIDNGTELFGPTSGSGFGELTKLDGDKNGWIDEADAAFGLLRLWSPDASGGGTLAGLADRGIGAVSLLSALTPFSVKDGLGQLLGTVRQTGLYLNEDGTPGLVQHVDLTA